MSSWVIKGKPSRNDLETMLGPGKVDRWVTRKPPRGWRAGDRLFFWSSSPALRLVGLGQLERARPVDDAGDAYFHVRYLTDPLTTQLGIEELRADPVVGDASFLKAGAAGTVFPLTEAQASRLLELSQAQNAELADFVWPHAERQEPARAPTATATRPTLPRSPRKPRPAPPEDREAQPPADKSDEASPRLALSIRQPWAELILRGVKTFEGRSRPTNIRGRVHIYASLGPFDPDEIPRVERKYGLDIASLPRGVIVGTVEIVGCRLLTTRDSAAACFTVDPAEGGYGWALERPLRATRLVQPTKHPQPVFFRPF